MILLSPREVAHALHTAGFGKHEPTDTLHDAVRVAFAESGVPGKHFVASRLGYVPAPSNADPGAADNGFACCDARTVNLNTDASHDYGLMQINSGNLPDLAPLATVTDPWNGTTFDWTSPLFDAGKCASFAYFLFVRDGRVFNGPHGWSSFENQTYLNFHAEAAWGCHLDWCDRHGRPWVWA